MEEDKDKISPKLHSSFIISFIATIALIHLFGTIDPLCGLVVRVLGYRSGGPGSIPSTTRKKKQWVWNGVHSAS
jgi:hypothetical protein